MIVQGIEKIIIRWGQVQRNKVSPYGITGYMRPGIVIEEQYLHFD